MAGEAHVADQCQRLLTLAGQTKHLPDVAGAGNGGALERRQRRVALEPLRERCPAFRSQVVEAQAAKQGKRRTRCATTVRRWSACQTWCRSGLDCKERHPGLLLYWRKASKYKKRERCVEQALYAPSRGNGVGWVQNRCEYGSAVLQEKHNPVMAFFRTFCADYLGLVG